MCSTSLRFRILCLSSVTVIRHRNFIRYLLENNFILFHTQQNIINANRISLHLPTLPTTKPPLPLPIPNQSLLQLPLVEVRPQHVAKVQFRVRRIPKQKIGQPSLPPRPHDEIRIGHLRRAHPPRQFRLVVQCLDGQFPFGDRYGQILCGAEYVRSSSVVDRQAYRQRAMMMMTIIPIPIPILFLLHYCSPSTILFALRFQSSQFPTCSLRYSIVV
mmetsp:Transcript_17914/g.28996  ORF Transcript_17914/g.28996 Transcript_17914/m.28996 type:complete len:216 (+) Transcript_17914:48-695(+)